MSAKPITDEELHFLTFMSSMSVPGSRHGGQLVAAMVLQLRDEIAELKECVANLIEDVKTLTDRRRDLSEHF